MATQAAEWMTDHGPLLLGGRCLVMGVLNVTPDSFSDGGQYATVEAATARALQMQEEGADVLDIGGESTRPGSSEVPADVQIERVIPVIRKARAGGVTRPISIDTRSALVAEAALKAGADMVNDVSAARHDPDMPRLLAKRRAPFVAMHMRGTPETMQIAPTYDNVIGQLQAFFEERAAALDAAGVDIGRMMIDPGIGFGKTLEHNLVILRSIASFRSRWPVLVGPSRKRFIGEILGANAERGIRNVESDPFGGRLMGTAAVVAHCALAGVAMVRVHDVRTMRQIVEVCTRLRGR